MSEIAALVAGLLNAVPGIITNLAPAGLPSIVSILLKAIPAAVQLGLNLETPIENIIAQLEGTGAVSPDQIAALRDAMTAAEADLDAAARDDGLTGADGNA